MNAGTRTFAGMSILAAGIVYYVHYTEQETKQVGMRLKHVNVAECKTVMASREC